MAYVYVVYHVDIDCDCAKKSEVRIIGVYQKEEDAKLVQELVENEQGEHPYDDRCRWCTIWRMKILQEPHPDWHYMKLGDKHNLAADSLEEYPELPNPVDEFHDGLGRPISCYLCKARDAFVCITEGWGIGYYCEKCEPAKNNRIGEERVYDI